MKERTNVLTSYTDTTWNLYSQPRSIAPRGHHAEERDEERQEERPEQPPEQRFEQDGESSPLLLPDVASPTRARPADQLAAEFMSPSSQMSAQWRSSSVSLTPDVTRNDDIEELLPSSDEEQPVAQLKAPRRPEPAGGNRVEDPLQQRAAPQVQHRVTQPDEERAGQSSVEPVEQQVDQQVEQHADQQAEQPTVHTFEQQAGQLADLQNDLAKELAEELAQDVAEHPSELTAPYQAQQLAQQPLASESGEQLAVEPAALPAAQRGPAQLVLPQDAAPATEQAAPLSAAVTAPRAAAGEEPADDSRRGEAANDEIEEVLTDTDDQVFPCGGKASKEIETAEGNFEKTAFY